jgi:trimeric autotransporter adhesin
MKTQTSLRFAVTVLAALNSIGNAAPLGTAFTYQGQLADGGSPASGTYDLRFAIYDSATNGSVVAGPITNSPAGVTNGLFSASLDFGAGVFTGDARWLEIGVRPTGSMAYFTTLAPRQPLTPGPYALYAPSADTAATATLANGVADNAVTAAGIASAQVVKSLNGLRDDVTLAAGPNVTLTPSGQTLTVATPADWHLAGNAATTPGTDFLGTTDNRPLEIKVNRLRALRLEDNGDGNDSDTTPDGAPNVIGGAPPNFVLPGVVGATISGGGALNYDGSACLNAVLGDYGTVGGGLSNLVDRASFAAAIAGGLANDIGTNSPYGAVGGGFHNSIADNSPSANIGGGLGNSIGTNSDYSMIGGGNDNIVADNSHAATLAGGSGNGTGAWCWYSAIGGGYDNHIADSSFYATIAGGNGNCIGTGVYHSAIGGGYANTNNSGYATIVGGGWNSIGTNSGSSVIGGGFHNSIADNSLEVTIAGGYLNRIGTNSDTTTIGGGHYHNISSNSANATIAGGAGNSIGAEATSSVIGGGSANTIDDNSLWAVVAGGNQNAAGPRAYCSVIGGGYGHTIGESAQYATIGGGCANDIGTNSAYSVIGGGSNNVIGADAPFAMIPGGDLNFATNYALAAGRRAKANHTGSFVWGDSTDADIASTRADSITMRAAGGYRLFSDAGAAVGVRVAAGGNAWSAISDRSLKENFRPVDTRQVLEKVAALSITDWNLISQAPSIRHIGPMAQDFRAAFAVGEDDRHISTSDADGVALAAIQGLNRKLEEKNAALEKEVTELKALVQALAKRVNGGGR